jgi:hypothetical protein
VWGFAGRFEFTKFFPDNTQGVLLQPLGEAAVMVLATDTQRGFGQIDQVGLHLNRQSGLQH